jgi:cell wall-associated NlpC family hydrolase
MFRYTSSTMVGLRTRGERHAGRAAAHAASRLLCACALALLAVSLLPAAAQASPGSIDDLEAQARSVRRQVGRLDHRAEVLTERYNVARAALDVVNIRLQEARRDLERARVEFDTAQALRGDRLAAMYKSDGYSVLDVLLNLGDLGDADTQLGYFRSIDEADQETVSRIAAMEDRIQELTRQMDADRAVALEKEMGLREQQAAIEDELAAREQLLTDLDARVKKLLTRQARLDAAASARLARAAGVDLATIHGTPAQIAVVKETMKYLGIPYVWAGATPSGGFDCSGLVLYVYAKFGVQFPHGATMQAHMGDPVSLANAQPADLVFFGYPAFYHHVGIYIGNGLFIEAPHTGDVVKVSRLAGRGCSLICRYDISLP